MSRSRQAEMSRYCKLQAFSAELISDTATKAKEFVNYSCWAVYNVQ